MLDRFKFDKFKLYLLQAILLVVLVLALFESNIVSKSVLAFVLLTFAFLLSGLLKKRKILSMYKKQVMILSIGLGIIYLALFYLSGLYFGYYINPVKFSFWGIYTFIIPISIIIISSEVMRSVLLAQKGKFNSFITFISMTLIDIIVYSQVYDISNLDDFLTVFGFIVFSSVSCNLLYNYMSVRFGAKPIIVYRLITSLYAYIIPIIPDVFIFFRSIGRMVYPYIIYLLLEYTYSKNNKVSAYRDNKKRIIETSIIVVIMVLVSMLISCKFRYGILVVGSGSMTGSIDVGDAVVFESYNNQVINEGDVIIFNKNDMQVIHRVVKTEIVNNEYRYYTKGDANVDIDNWYVSKSEIMGVTIFKIKYIGYPTIWVNDIFSK